MIFQIRRMGLSILTIGFLALVMTAYRHHNQQDPIPPLDRLTGQQALQQSEQLCDTIAPTIGTWNLSVERHPSAGSNWWYVSCSDSTGQRVINLEWNADTRELFNVSSAYVSEEDDRGIRNSVEAIRYARYWLRTLPFAESAKSWRVASVQEGGQKLSWTVEWVGESQHVAIQIDAHTGDVRLAMCRILHLTHESENAGLLVFRKRTG